MRNPFVPLLVLILFLAAEARAQEYIYIKFPAVLAPGAAVGERVLDECQPEDRLGATILNSVLRIHNNRTRVAGADNGRDKVFELTILNVLGAGGGAYSGAKTLHVRADIVQNGTVLATREFERRTKKSIKSGTCRLLDIAAKDLGREVAMWLPASSELAGAAPAARTQPASAARAAPAKVDDPAERLRQLKQLRDEGLIDDKEYEQKRGELLKRL